MNKFPNLKRAVSRYGVVKGAIRFLSRVQKEGISQTIKAIAFIAKAHKIKVDLAATLTAYSHGSILTGRMVKKLAGKKWQTRLKSSKEKYHDIEYIIMGAGKMGSNMAALLNDQKLPARVVDPDLRALSRVKKFKHILPFNNLDQALIKTANKPRVVALMVPASLIPVINKELINKLEPNDVVVDLGNTYFEITLRQYRLFDSRPIHYLAAGTSGGVLGLGGKQRGVRGARHGACFMVDGQDEYALRRAGPLLTALGLNHKFTVVGLKGAGHLVKGMHNAQEYVEMEALGRIVEYWRDKLGLDWKQILKQAKEIQASEAGSYLGDCIVYGLKNQMLPEPGPIGGITIGEMITLVNEARKLGAPLPLAEEAIETRLKSSLLINQTTKTQIIYLQRKIFGGHDRRMVK